MPSDENTFKDAFERAMTIISTSYERDELAYLALTSKIELPIRDKVAFHMGEHYKSENLIAAREWARENQRSDLAILKDRVPLAIFEFKAMYSFDGISKQGRTYLDLMRKDLEKAKVLATDKTELYSVLLVTHPGSEIGDGLHGIVKYQSDINRAFSKYTEQYRNKAQVRILEECNKNLEDGLTLPSKITRGHIDAGEYFDINVTIYYWLVGPFLRSDDISSVFYTN